MNGQASFEKARDTIRHEIHSHSPVQFPYGTRGTSFSALASTIFALRILWPSQVLNVPVVNILNCPLMTDYILCYMRKKIHKHQLVIG
jgi:hypothetical protein